MTTENEIYIVQKNHVNHYLCQLEFSHVIEVVSDREVIVYIRREEQLKPFTLKIQNGEYTRIKFCLSARNDPDRECINDVNVLEREDKYVIRYDKRNGHREMILDDSDAAHFSPAPSCGLVLDLTGNDEWFQEVSLLSAAQYSERCYKHGNYDKLYAQCDNFDDRRVGSKQSIYPVDWKINGCTSSIDINFVLIE